ncbi:hypothetical protein SAMN05421504_10460 [Amycolatopsis xylanica]|uniref:Transmembrane transport protein n=1 Tax=Amycolatopsis xylanica TaxID=589385 RepID=A0A1H3FZU8_9PSEU|nr:hypothetical protein [Amycolatopsis xylanica]SDX96365.1 hypothetical protein SAMN05421504_10460 [Amycolatopsis xylanica]
MDDFEQPSLTADQVLARLTPGARVRYAVVALAGLAGALLISALWVTEPVPARTQVAFGVLVLIGLGWAGFGVWALTCRGPLFARDRVVAGWLALAFSVLACAGMTVIAVVRSGNVLVAATTGAALVVAATTLLMRARARHAFLSRRKAELGP